MCCRWTHLLLLSVCVCVCVWGVFCRYSWEDFNLRIWHGELLTHLFMCDTTGVVTCVLALACTRLTRAPSWSPVGAGHDGKGAWWLDARGVWPGVAPEATVGLLVENWCLQQSSWWSKMQYFFLLSWDSAPLYLCHRSCHHTPDCSGPVLRQSNLSLRHLWSLRTVSGLFG